MTQHTQKKGKELTRQNKGNTGSGINEVIYETAVKEKLKNPSMTVRELADAIGGVHHSTIARYIRRYLEENKDSTQALAHFNDQLMLEGQEVLTSVVRQLRQKNEISAQEADVLSKIMDRAFKQNRLIAGESTQNISNITQINIVNPNDTTPSE